MSLLLGAAAGRDCGCPTDISVLGFDDNASLRSST